MHVNFSLPCNAAMCYLNESINLSFLSDNAYTVFLSSYVCKALVL